MHNAVSLKWFSVVVYLLSILITIPFSRFDVTFSVAFGGAVALSGLFYMEHFLGIILSGKVSAPLARGLSIFSFYFRLAVIGFVTYKMLTSGILHVPSLLAGLSVTVFSIFAWHLLFGGKYFSEEHERTN